MLRIVAVVCALVCAIAVRPALAQQVVPSPSIVIENVTVINVDTGARWPDQTVVVTGNRISAVGRAASVTRSAGARVVDGRGKFLIPGLWDAHVHALFNGFDRAMPYLAAIGVTSVRDMASSFAELADARRPREDLNFIAPRLAVATGPGLDGVPPNFGPLPVPPGVLLVITTPEQGRAIVNTLGAAKVDAIKVRNALTTETYMAIAQEAKRWGIPFDGHLPPDVNIVQASDAGQRVVEHLQGLAALCAANPGALNQGRGRGAGPAQGQAPPPQPIELNRARCEETARHLVRNGTWLTPTIGAPVPETNPVRQFNLRITQIAAQAGVPMLAGTDWPGINFSNGQRSVHQELAGLVEAGLTPQQALRTATVNPARLFNLSDQLGSIEQGKLADLLLLDADPLVDITNTTKIAAVVVDGKLVDATRRQKMLDEFAAILKKSAAPAAAPQR
jgi:imidazolonepropionase-like amidohydrolase